MSHIQGGPKNDTPSPFQRKQHLFAKNITQQCEKYLINEHKKVLTDSQ